MFRRDVDVLVVTEHVLEHVLNYRHRVGFAGVSGLGCRKDRLKLLDTGNESIRHLVWD